mgnify:FL=1
MMVYLFTFFLVKKYILKDPELRKWFLSSFSENGAASGKSLTAFLFANILGFATIVAVIYSDSHILPEYYLIAILTFIGSLYGIKVASKYYDSKATNNTTTTTTSTQEVDDSKITMTEKKEESKSNPKESKNNPEDVG